MWPFRRKKKERSTARKVVNRVVTGLIIGAAISSIVGKKMLEMQRKDEDEK
jgi:hypothetical protein